MIPKHQLSHHIINLNVKQDQQALFTLMNAYMMDKMGIEEELSSEHFKQILIGLQQQCNYRGIVVTKDDEAVGLANCFVNFSTFKAKPLLNIHDFIILPKYRELGIGRYLMQSVKQFSKANKHCKITLEVREDNTIAQSLYQSECFTECQPNMLFWEYK